MVSYDHNLLKVVVTESEFEPRLDEKFYQINRIIVNIAYMELCFLYTKCITTKCLHSGGFCLKLGLLRLLFSF